MMQLSIPKIKLLCIWKAMLDLECFSPAFNRHTIYKNFIQYRPYRHIISCTWFVLLVFLQCLCLLNPGLEDSRSNLFSKGPDGKIILFSECCNTCHDSFQIQCQTHPWQYALAVYTFTWVIVMQIKQVFYQL